MTRVARIAAVVGVLAAVQVGALLVYRAVERSRAASGPRTELRGERLRGDEPAPALDATRADGSAVSLAWPSPDLRVVHFWATWCEPCRDELPGLLALAGELRGRGVELVAVAVDDDWDAIRAFFDGTVPPAVVVTRDPDLHKRFGVSTLPDTYVVDRDGRLVERFHGARDWRTAAARDHLLDLAE
jgi:thiol-disulfide isomerase/thioredoxin